MTSEKMSFCLALTCKEYPDFFYVTAIKALKIDKLYLMLDGEKFLNVVFQNSFGAMPAKPKRFLHNMSRQQNNVVSASAYSRVG